MIIDFLTQYPVLLALGCIAIYAIALLRSSNYHLPPGPPRNSLLGNTWPTEFSYRFFEHWTREYGPVFSLRQGMETIIVIGRYDAAVDIMEREGASLADRPRSIGAGETLSGGMRVLLTPHGERFKKMRRALHAHLQPKSVAGYEDVLTKASMTHLRDLVRDPSRHQDHAKRYAAGAVMALAYGKIPGSFDDPEVQSVNRCLTRLGFAMRPGAWKVDIFPWLRFMPGYLKPLRDGHAEELSLFKSLLKEVKDSSAPPASFGLYLLERQAELELSDDETAYLAGSMFGAGSDTTASAISVALMAAAVYPETQEPVRRELRALGHPPTFADKEALPRTMAFVNESFRWRPVTAGGFPHKATRDVVWNGYVIPAGATVIGNVWSVGRDPAYFPDPEKFEPSRWMTATGDLRTDVKSYPFGFGRRVCPGQHLATASVFLNTALVLYYFSLSTDEKAPIDTLAFTHSANAHPEPFKLVFTPEDNDWESAREAIEQYFMAL